MKTFVRRSAFFALIGFILSPLALAHALSPSADSVHFCQLSDYEQWRRDHPRPAGKRLALDVGEPRTVRMIYFLPNDRPYRQEVVDEMKATIRRVQTFYAEQMEAHGYGYKTFRFETDAQGEPLVHRVDGRHPNSYYRDIASYRWDDELWEVFDVYANIYNMIMDGDSGIGGGSRTGKTGGAAWLNESYIWGSAHGGYAGATAHEIGHAFGLWHDWRDDAYIMSYGPRPNRLSACAAEFLSVHPYFNPEISFEEGSPPTIELISPRTYPAGSKSVPIQLKVADSEGLHQVILVGGPRDNFSTVKICRGLSGERDTVVEFEYDGVIPSAYGSNYSSSLSDLATHLFSVQVVDLKGNLALTEFSLAEASPYLIATLEGHRNWVSSLSFSPDGTTLASAGSSGTVILWDVATQERIAALQGYAGRELSFSPDGTTLASAGSSGTVILWDVRTQERITTLEGPPYLVSSLSFSPNGALLAYGDSEGTIILWDVATRERVVTLQGHRSAVTSVSFSPDGTLLASGSEDYTVKLWDVATRERVATLQRHRSVVTSVSFSSDGTLLASAPVWQDGMVELWDVATRERIATLQGHTEGASSVSFSASDGALLATGGWDGKVILWDVLKREQIVAFGHTDKIYSMAFSPDGTTLAAGGRDGAISLWNIEKTAHRLTKVSGDGQEGLVGEQLAKPFVVSVLDQNGSAFAGAVVTFSVTAGGGTLSATTVTTDANGRAVTRLTLGSELGTNTVEATVEGLKFVTFTAIGQATADSDGDELADDEPSGEDQQESEETPTSTVELEGISSSHTSVHENDEQATSITLTVTLDKAAATDEKVTFSIVTPTEGKTAKRGEDFDATLDETLTIAKGQIKGTAQLTLTPLDNTTVDGDKAFGVQAASSSGHAALLNIKIVDDEMDDGEMADGEEGSEMAFAFAEEVEDQAYTAGAAISALVLPEAMDGEGEVTYSVSELPAGLSFDTSTRTISGTPEAVTDGAVEVTYTAQDSAGATAILTFSITVNPPLSFGDLFGGGAAGKAN